jgi:hypothetical protein
MALPGVTLALTNGNLGLQAANSQNILVYLGMSEGGATNELTFYGDSTAMGAALNGGELLEAASYELSITGAQVGVMNLPISTVGGLSSVTHTGSGAMTMGVSSAPSRAISIACTTGGVLGTAVFTFALGSGNASAPVTSSASWATTGYRVPGTYTTLVFVTGTYVTADTYAVSVLGAVTHPTGTGPAVPTQTSSPVDAYTPTITVTTAGALGTSQFTYSLDGTAGNTSGAIVTTGGGTYALPATGIVLTFSGTAVAGDTYAFSSVGPMYSNADLTTALGVLETTYLSSTYSMAAVLGNLADASAWATQCATLETAGTTLFNQGVYVRFFNGAPTVGSVTASGGSVVVNSTSTDSALQTARLGVSAPHVAACAGDALLTSVVTGLSQRRNASWMSSTRAALVPASQNIGAVQDGALPGVTYLYRNETVTPGLDAVGFITLRSFPGSVSTGTGLTGFYITNGHTMDSVTSDFYPLTNARVIDLACAVARAESLPLVNSKIPTKDRPNYPGAIAELRARQIESAMSVALQSALVNAQPQNAVGASAVVNRFNNVLATSQLIIGVNVQPYGYATYILVYIGLATAA